MLAYVTSKVFRLEQILVIEIHLIPVVIAFVVSFSIKNILVLQIKLNALLSDVVLPRLAPNSIIAVDFVLRVIVRLVLQGLS